MSQEPQTNTGVVKWFNAERGYGFVKVDDQKLDVFVHVSNLLDKDRPPEIGDRVEFVIVQGKKGQEAQQVRRL